MSEEMPFMSEKEFQHYIARKTMENFGTYDQRKAGKRFEMIEEWRFEQ